MSFSPPVASLVLAFSKPINVGARMGSNHLRNIEKQAENGFVDKSIWPGYVVVAMYVCRSVCVLHWLSLQNCATARPLNCIAVQTAEFCRVLQSGNSATMCNYILK